MTRSTKTGADSVPEPGAAALADRLAPYAGFAVYRRADPRDPWVKLKAADTEADARELMADATEPGEYAVGRATFRDRPPAGCPAQRTVRQKQHRPILDLFPEPRQA